jgi:hypothetical protein
MVTVRTKLPEPAATSTTIQADLEIQFAGQTAQYKQVSFQLAKQGGQIRIPGLSPRLSAILKLTR